ncbi:MAG: glycosyltransferase family 2 protein [Faecousia sp.]
MRREKLLSVIVPVYNVETYLPRCVDSILQQSYENLEVLLVDDGSRDASGRICDEYAAGDPRIKVIHKENGGLSSARNAGLDAAAGEYLTFVDSDDWIEPDAYDSMIALLEESGAALVCGGRYDVDGKTGEKTVGLCPKKTEKISGEEMAGRLFLWDGCDSSACDKLYRSGLFAFFRYPEGKVCEDVCVTYRILLEAETVVLWDRPFYNYYHRPDSITTAGLSEKSFHFSQHTAEIYPYIRDRYPDIESQARFFRVRSLSHILLLLDQAEKEDRQCFGSEYRQARKELRKHTRFFLTSPYFGSQERIRDLLLVLGLYRRMRPLLHRK